MQLQKGSRLGPYEVEALLGAGGMGEVYKARDTRLERSVALKILPAEFSENAHLKLRFEREAKTISQPTHPHICTLYDVGDGYLVMELLDGESLADRLSRGPLSRSEVFRYGAEIADALDRAHRAGVTHRDLKPANVMLTKSGAKLLDFGLARTDTAQVIGASDVTQQKPLTAEGAILGTFQYMAPEQLDGIEADPRTDIFALGCVLYEMLTGKRAFEGKTRTSLIAAIVSGEPRRITDIDPLTPAAFEHVVAKCLAKTPDDRWQSAHDIAEELRWIAASGSQASVGLAGSSRIRRRRWILSGAIAGWLLALGALAVLLLYAPRYRSATRVVQADFAARLSRNQDAPLAVSPDGQRVALLSWTDRVTRLFVRELPTGENRALAGTEGASYPFWSPDSRSLGFFSSAKLKTINTDTGAVQILCDAPYGRGASWSQAGVIVFTPNIGAPLMKVSENGGAVTAVTKLAHSGGTHRNPLFLPDGRRFLYCSGDVRGNAQGANLRVGSIDGSMKDRVLLDYASNAALVDGWLFTVRDRNLIAQRFDSDKVTLSGKPVAIAQNVDAYAQRYLGIFGAGADTLVYHRAAHPVRQFVLFDPRDARVHDAGAAGEYALPSLSPDARRVIVNRFDKVTNSSDLWMYDFIAASWTRLSFSSTGTMEDSAVFSRDGQRVIMSVTQPNAHVQVYAQAASGGKRDLLLDTVDSTFVCDWSPDEKVVLICPQRSLTGQDIEIIRLDSPATPPLPLLHDDASELSARFSPNGKWVAYHLVANGRADVFVTDYPAGSGKWQVSAGGGSAPHWSPDGKQIYFRESDGISVANVKAGDSFSSEVPRPLPALGKQISDYAVAANGTIVALRELDPGDEPLTVVINWRQLLREK